MPVRFFPIINQESRLALEACPGPEGLIIIAEYNGRDNQLWFSETDTNTIHSKVYPKKALTLDENWNRRGWGKVHLQNRHFLLETQKWKIKSGLPSCNEIISLCRNPNRLDSLKLMVAGRQLLCSKMKREGQQIWLLDANLRRNPRGPDVASSTNSSLVASKGTITPIKV